MTAAVYGRHSLDELQQLVVDAFSPVEDQQLPVPSFSPDVFCDEVGASGNDGIVWSKGLLVLAAAKPQLGCEPDIL